MNKIATNVKIGPICWISKTIELRVNAIRVEPIRTHFKFNTSQMNQQMTQMSRMIAKTQNTLNKLIQNKPIIVSKGAPNRVPNERAQRGQPMVSSRRMNVLNKLLMQSISEVLSTEDISKDFDRLQVHITQVKVNGRCDYANVYWISKSDETERVSEMLDQLKGRLHQHLMDRNLMHSVPWLQFVFDITENHSQEIEKVLKKCDFGPDFTPFDKTLFETPYEKLSRSDGKPKNKTYDKFKNDENVYEFIEIKKPIDMKMDCLGLDYQFIMNTVLSNLNKSRAQHRSFNAVADPLPPPDWSTPPPAVASESDATYNTDERIKAMKQFLVQNRKKREKLSRNAKRNEILKELEISYNLNEAFNTFDVNYQQIDEEMGRDLDSSLHFEGSESE